MAPPLPRVVTRANSTDGFLMLTRQKTITNKSHSAVFQAACPKVQYRVPEKEAKATPRKFGAGPPVCLCRCLPGS